MEQLAAVTAADLTRVAKKYLNPEALQIVAIGDAAKITPLLAKFGKVQVFDPDAPPQVAAGGSKE